jgi:hypothetical protein
MIRSLPEGVRTERDVINILGTLLEIVSSSRSREIFKQLRLDSEGLFHGLPTKNHPKIAGFEKHQLIRAFSRG